MDDWLQYNTRKDLRRGKSGTTGRRHFGDRTAVPYGVAEGQTVSKGLWCQTRRQVEETESGQLARVRSKQHVIVQRRHSRLSAVVLMVRRLCRWHQDAVNEVLQSHLDNSLQQFGEKREVGHRPIVLHLAGVKSTLLQKWTNHG